jgi:hypothetical protein
MLFSRHTDRYVWEILGKKPMEVGADRIARTAHAALELLHNIRTETGYQIPLAFSPKMNELVEVIEVYPGATLAARGLKSSGYKPAVKQAVRKKLIEELNAPIRFDTPKINLMKNAHIFDAMICILAGLDFLQNRCFEPDNIDLALKEGWIWVMNPWSEPAEV